MTREHPILFRPELVRKILDGTKTVTRRLVKLEDFGRTDTPGYQWHFRDRRSLWNDVTAHRLVERWSPYGGPGDTLWVREAFHIEDTHQPDDYPWICYRADGQWQQHDYHSLSGPCDRQSPAPAQGWKPSIHMPRWASRLTLCVTDVRVERLQDITSEDAQAEGFEPVPGHGEWAIGKLGRQGHWSAREPFAKSWDANNDEAAGWKPNPWVWRIAFTRI